MDNAHLIRIYKSDEIQLRFYGGEYQKQTG